MHSNLECIKYNINIGVSSKFFPVKNSKCLNPRWIISKGRGRATIFYVHTVRNKKKMEGGRCNRLLFHSGSARLVKLI